MSFKFKFLTINIFIPQSLFTTVAITSISQITPRRSLSVMLVLKKNKIYQLTFRLVTVVTLICVPVVAAVAVLVTGYRQRRCVGRRAILTGIVSNLLLALLFLPFFLSRIPASAFFIKCSSGFRSVAFAYLLTFFVYCLVFDDVAHNYTLACCSTYATTTSVAKPCV